MTDIGFLFVGLGGAAGAMLRYAISMLPHRGEFPVLTLLTNLLGAILIGFIVGVSTRHKVSENAMLFLKTGLCGGFTTFSTFSLESFNLMKSGHYGLMALYMALSLVLCFAGVWLGACAGERIR